MNNFKKLIFFIVAIISLSITAQVDQNKDTIAQLDALFKMWNTHTPGGSLAIQKDGKMIYHKAFGMADLEQGAINTIHTKFEAGSVSKQFTATSVLQLVSEGKISLDDDIRKYIPELPEYDKVIEIRHLLHHTSGVKDWGAIARICGWPRTTRVYTQDYARDYIFRQKSLNNAPGEEYLYSNSNYTLLATLVERVSGQTLPEYTEEEFFGPLGMEDTEWRDNFREIIPDRATGYDKSRGEYVTVMPFENTYGHAALLTTTADLITWNESWLHGELGKELSKLRMQKGTLSNGLKIPYAAAVFIKDVNGLQEISHSGATAGYRAWLAYYPEIDLSIAYLSNDGSVSTTGTGRKVFEIFVKKTEDVQHEYSTIELPMDVLKMKAGLYKDLNSYELLEMVVKNGSLYIGSRELKAISPDTLFRNNTKYIFNGDQLKVTTSTNPIIYKKVERTDPNKEALQEYIGNYSSEEAAGALEIEIKGDDLYSILTPSASESLTPSFNDAFYASRRKLYKFKRDKNGEVIGLYISVPRAENIYFRKDH